MLVNDVSSSYTPSPIINATKRVIGRINLDPYSDARGNSIVKADRYFDKNLELGFKNFWRGNVFCRPPGGKLTKMFMFKCSNSNYVPHAIFVVDRTQASWYQGYLNSGYWDAVCEVKEKIQFVSSKQVPLAVNRCFTDIIYHGPYVELFSHEFSIYGDCRIFGR